jgi:proteasome lid subunit RPN8/RPN11
MAEIGSGDLAVLCIASSFTEDMRKHVELMQPEEACGLLPGKDGQVTAVIPVTNELHSPVRFRMDPIEMLAAFQRMDRFGEDLLGIYHSHPKGPAVPSPTDLVEFAYPGVLYLIWSPLEENAWQVRGFAIEEQVFREVRLSLTSSNF